MRSVFHVSLRSLRRALFVSIVCVLAAGIVFGGPVWFLMVPALFALGRTYGSRSEPQDPAGHVEYGAGAALAGFTPAIRK